MGLFDVQDTHEALEDLLMRERGAILAGKFDDIEPLAMEKERLLKALSRTRIDSKALERIKELSERNALLYDAVRAGVGSALERLRSMREPRANLQTYDQSGRRRDISIAEAKTNRRA